MFPTDSPEANYRPYYSSNGCPRGSSWNGALNRCQAFTYNENINLIRKEHIPMFTTAVPDVENRFLFSKKVQCPERTQFVKVLHEGTRRERILCRRISNA